MKIFTAAQIRACDAQTIQAQRLSSLELMERAAARCTQWLRERFPKDTLFVVLCGTGNNGGDGFAIARQLHHAGAGVKAFLLQLNSELSADCQANMQRLKNIDEELVGIVRQDTFITDIPRHIVIIDAIFGTGLSRPASGWVASFINHINQLKNTKVSIDMPSGLGADVIPDSDASIIKADHTLSFQLYKRTLLHPEAAWFAGNIELLDIGLDAEYINNTSTQFNTLDATTIANIYKGRQPYSHKGTYGHALLAGGSTGKMGAMTLCTLAALRAGSGLVTALIPAVGYHILQTAAPEAMCRTSGQQCIEQIENWQQYTTVGIGPGMGTDGKTAAAFAAFIDGCTAPIVADADALNLLAAQPELMARLPKGSVITPHPKEFNRLFGENTNSMIQVDHARIQAMRYNINIVLKGHHTAIITAEGDCWYNMTGNAGMATGGTGDVLTGIITGLLAQGYEPAHAAMLGVYLHGMAGDLAAADLSEEALIAGDVINYLGKAFLAIRQALPEGA